MKYIWIVAGVAVVGALGWWAWYMSNPGKYDALAECLEEKGVIFYGAFWCPHCQEQKALFGKSKNLLPYFECSTANGQAQTQECTEKGIKGYPTWEFPGGEREARVMTPEELAEKSGCPLPE